MSTAENDDRERRKARPWGHGRLFFQAVSLLLFGGSLLFFYECLTYLSRRDYVAALILMFIGFAVIRVGAELARLALLDSPDGR